MLRRMCAKRPKDLDRYLPALLFVIREAIQESLGFSPFELLYERGVMAIFKKKYGINRLVVTKYIVYLSVCN